MLPGIQFHTVDLVIDITVLRWWWSVVCGVVVCVEKKRGLRKEGPSSQGAGEHAAAV